MNDVTIIGAGVSGIFLAYTLINRNTDFKIQIIEKGNELNKRICPIEKGLSCRCVACNTCNKMLGFGGLGKSEGKYNYTTDFGGSLGEKLGIEKTLNLMEKVDRILCSFGADVISTYNTKNIELEKKAINYGFNVLSSDVRHLGTKLSSDILERFYQYLNEKVMFSFQTQILSIEKKSDRFILYTNNEEIQSRNVVVSTGVSGKEWLFKQCNKFNIPLKKTRVDIGIRVEMRGDQLDNILKHSFETKLIYKGKGYEAFTYCMNPMGRVIKKYQDGLVLADGQNYLEEKQSHNLNFTLFVPMYFNSSLDASNYLKGVVKKINQDKERILIQRLCDLKKQKSTTISDISKNTIVPSLVAEAGNLYHEIPTIYIKALLETINALEGLLEGKIDDDTLLYGVDAKVYEPTIELTNNFESKIKGLYFIGDCSGLTSSLSQAAACGVYVGEELGDRFE